MREMHRRLGDAGVRVHDIEFVTIGEGFVAQLLAPVLESAAELGAERLSVCGDDPNRSRLVASFAELCDLAAGFDMGVDLECMVWRQITSLPEAVRVVLDAGRSNGGVLVDALYLSRTGGLAADLRDIPPGLIRSVQLCDAPAGTPESTDAIIREDRSGRLPPCEVALPLRELLAGLPSPSRSRWATAHRPRRARRVFEATQKLFNETLGAPR